jgi:phage shock protein E
MKQLAGILFFVLSLTACADDSIDVKQWAVTGVIIDTRTIDEWNSGHIEGATLIPFDIIGPNISKVAATNETPILLYCRSGRRAGVAEETLRNLGYTNVINLGGMSAAKKALGK